MSDSRFAEARAQKKTSPDVRFIQGNEVCAEAAIYAGLRFFAGYPITPSTEIAERLSERLPRIGGRFIKMEDEIGSLCAVIGASLTGAKAMTATSGPGFSLMQEAVQAFFVGQIAFIGDVIGSAGKMINSRHWLAQTPGQ